jgi:leader peptidase (prepilin peptidase) / N-methyltransferase
MIELSILELIAATVFGALIGSFLNVIVYRLPIMMENQWRAEYEELTSENNVPILEHSPEKPKFNLAIPRSRCQKCQHQIHWYENIPVISFLFLKGCCSNCKSKISIRYPAVEIFTAGMFFYCIYSWGFNFQGVIWCLFSSALIVLALIDWDTTLLPDDITLPLVWLGIICSLLGFNNLSLASSVSGAIIGYMSLWTIYWIFKIITKKEGMGYGDFKLFAALGAWFGANALLPIILVSSIIGAIIGIGMKIKKNLRPGGYIPFGPFLVIAGFSCLFIGPEKLTEIIQNITRI